MTASNAQEILARRNAEVEARRQAERVRVAALFEAYPDIKAWCLDMKSAFDGHITNFRNSVHGPLKQAQSYPATQRNHLDAPKSRKGRR